MKPIIPPVPLTRRDFARRSSAVAVAALGGGLSGWAQAADAHDLPASATAGAQPDNRFVPPPLLTPADQFRDVSRGNPKIWTLAGDDLVKARLTPETWRLEITADATPNPAISESAVLGKPLTLAGAGALDLAGLMELGKKRGVKFLKAMQCLNIPSPLGQGLWEGVTLRDVLKLCGAMRNVRRLYYWGYHNHDPRQLFQSSLSYTEAMETPPGELPAFLAYRLNGEPLSLLRGGPVRMVVPWAHGFKSIKWLQGIAVTNDYKANDTYAEANNDPESHLKTAAYLASLPANFRAGEPVLVSGLVISGLSGLQRVEYCLSGAQSHFGASSGTEAEEWKECRLEAPPRDWSGILPAGVSPQSVLGFDPKTGEAVWRKFGPCAMAWFPGPPRCKDCLLESTRCAPGRWT